MAFRMHKLQFSGSLKVRPQPERENSTARAGVKKTCLKIPFQKVLKKGLQSEAVI